MDFLEDIQKGKTFIRKLAFLRDNPIVKDNVIVKGIASKDKNIVEGFACSLTRLLGDSDTPFDKYKEK